MCSNGANPDLDDDDDDDDDGDDRLDLLLDGRVDLEGLDSEISTWLATSSSSSTRATLVLSQ